MFAFVCGSKQDEGVGSDKENTPPPATSSPPWLKKRRLTPLSSPQDSGDDSDADILEGAVSVTSSVDNKHIRTVRSILCKVMTKISEKFSLVVDCTNHMGLVKIVSSS